MRKLVGTDHMDGNPESVQSLKGEVSEVACAKRNSHNGRQPVRADVDCHPKPTGLPVTAPTDYAARSRDHDGQQDQEKNPSGFPGSFNRWSQLFIRTGSIPLEAETNLLLYQPPASSA